MGVVRSYKKKLEVSTQIMDFTSHSQPTRFISMAASSLDTTLLSSSPSPRLQASCSLNNNLQSQQMRVEKHYIDPKSMIHFERKMESLGDDFERARKKMAFSTYSLLNDTLMLNDNDNDDEVLHGMNITPSSKNKLPNITNTPLPNTTLPLPITMDSKISSIGSAIDERLKNLRAKLLKLEQEDCGTSMESTYNAQPTHSDIASVGTRNIYNTQNTDIYPIKSTENISLNTIETTQNAEISPNTSFAAKYNEYMLKYHGPKSKKYRNRNIEITSHSFPDYNPLNNINRKKSRDNAQNLVARIQQKSKALFQYKSDIKPVPTQKNKRPFITDNGDKAMYDQTITNFDDQLNATWTKTRLQIDKIMKMNEHFKRSNQAKYNKSNQKESEYNQYPTPISLNEDTLNAEESKSDDQSVKSQTFFTMNTYNGDTTDIQKHESLINNKGIQVKIPVLCSRCNKDINSEDVQNKNNMLMVERKQMEYDDNKSNVLYQQICSTSTSTLSKSSSTRSFQNHSEIETATTISESDRKRLISELKSMDGGYGDLRCNNSNKWNYSDCRSDGILFDERKRTKDHRKKYAKSMLHETKKKKRTSLRSKLNDLKITMDTQPNNDYKCDEYLLLRNKLRSYENKLRSIDPTLLE